jgi:hypothetical protein
MSDPNPTAAGAVTVRLAMPDRWLEHVAELPLQTSIADAKAIGVRAMLMRDTDDPDDYYVEYAERQVRNEEMTLGELGFRPREMLAIRKYDLGHYRRFEG